MKHQWYISIYQKIPSRYDISIYQAGPNGGPALLHPVARSEEALEDFIRTVDPHWFGKPTLNPTSGALVIEAEPLEPGQTVEDLVKRAKIALEEPQCAASLVVTGKTFDELDASLAAWRSRGTDRS